MTGLIGANYFERTPDNCYYMGMQWHRYKEVSKRISRWEPLVDGATSCTGTLQPLTYRELTADISGVLTFTLRLREADNLAKLLRQCHCAPRAHQWLPVHCYLNKQKRRPKLQNHAVITRSRSAATASFSQCPLLTAEGWEMTQTVSLSSWDIQDVLSPYVNLLIQAILHSAAQPPFSVLLLWLCNFKGYNQQAWVLNHNLTPLVSYHRGD